MEGLCNPFTGCSRSSRETDCRAQPLTGSVYVLDSSAYLNCPWQICPVHGQDFLPVYYLVLRPAVSARVALWREIVGGRKLFSSSQRGGSLLIFLSFFFPWNFVINWFVMKGINVTFFLSFWNWFIVRSCILYHLFCQNSFTFSQERYCNCNIRCFDNGVVSTLCSLIFIIKMNVIRIYFVQVLKSFDTVDPNTRWLSSLRPEFEIPLVNATPEFFRPVLVSQRYFSKMHKSLSTAPLSVASRL